MRAIDQSVNLANHSSDSDPDATGSTNVALPADATLASSGRRRKPQDPTLVIPGALSALDSSETDSLGG